MFSKIKSVNKPAEYREETIKIPVLITAAILLVMAIPMLFWVFNINREGSLATDISKYDALVERVRIDLQEVNAMLSNDDEALAAIDESRQGQSVTLIVPEVVIIEEQAEKNTPFSITLEGIYWNPVKPLVGIAGETYRVGDKVKGFEIVDIRKTSVKFKRSDGSFIVKGMYDNLLQR